MSVDCCIGVMAYNEADNIGRLLEALIHQETKIAEIRQIIVVSSGCTDCTNEIVEKYIAKDPRICLLKQAKREGKASAVNLFLKNVKTEVVIMESADTLPTKNTIEALVTPFTQSDVGMVGGHPVPTNPKDTFVGFGVNLMWELHHRLSLIHPKMGELIAFRQIFRQIPYNTAVDEASIEPLIIGQGMRCIYARDAIVYNHGPENLRDFIKQRRRIYSGHIYVKETLGYQVATMNGWLILKLYLQMLGEDWRFWVWGPLVIIFELYNRFLGFFDYRFLRKNPFEWSCSESTKKLPEIEQLNKDDPIIQS